MTYTIDENNDALVVSVQGHLDIKTTPVLEAALKGKLNGVGDLTCDFAGVDYVSSSGLRLLVALQKRMFKQGEMRVVNVNEDVMQLLVDTGLAEIFSVSAAG